MTLKKKTTTELQSGNWMEVEDSKVINNATGKVAIVSQEKNGGVQIEIRGISGIPQKAQMRSRWKNSGNKGLYRRAIQDEIQRPKLPFIKNDTVEKTLVSSNGFTTDDGLSEKLKKEISIIANYIETESLRIERDYQEETREYLKGMLANSVGHMVLGIDYKELQIKTIDNLFGKLDTTFDEVRQGIRRDLDWQE